MNTCSTKMKSLKLILLFSLISFAKVFYADNSYIQFYIFLTSSISRVRRDLAFKCIMKACVQIVLLSLPNNYFQPIKSWENICQLNSNHLEMQRQVINAKFAKWNTIICAQFFPTDQGGWNFACQHGNNECIGNLYQVCLLDKTRQNNELQVNAINCIMSSKQPDLATAKVTFSALFINS